MNKVFSNAYAAIHDIGDGGCKSTKTTRDIQLLEKNVIRPFIEEIMVDLTFSGLPSNS